MADNCKLEAKVALVTGAGSGIGRSIALALAKQGAALVVCADLHPWSSTNEETEEDSTHKEIQVECGVDRALAFACDVRVERTNVEGPLQGNIGYSDPNESVLGVADLVERVVQKAGRLDILVCCAGRLVHGAPHEMSLEDWSENMSVNATGTFLAVKHCLAQFLKQDIGNDGYRGSIVNVASIGSQVGIRGCAAYCASKGAIEALSRSVAIDYAAQKVRCNTLSPGYIRTPLLQPFLETEGGFEGWLHSRIPAGHLGQPVDIARAAVWLANAAESGYVTGSTLTVDGGFTAM